MRVMCQQVVFRKDIQFLKCGGASRSDAFKVHYIICEFKFIKAHNSPSVIFYWENNFVPVCVRENISRDVEDFA